MGISIIKQDRREISCAQKCASLLCRSVKQCSLFTAVKVGRGQRLLEKPNGCRKLVYVGNKRRFTGIVDL